MLRGRLATLPCCVALASPDPGLFGTLASTAAPTIEVVAPVEPTPTEDAPREDASSEDTPQGDDAVADPEPSVDDAPAEGEPPRSESVFAPTRPPAPGDGVPEPQLGPGVPGGYWDLDRTRGREPKDGDDEVLAGSIIFPLGLLSVGSSAAHVWLSTPGHCESRWKSLGASPTRDQCTGLYAYGWVRLAYGSAMVVTGAVLLAIGLHRRRKHDEWERGYARMPSVTPWFGRGGGGVALSVRFGGAPRR